jgi:hypothetical protein
MGSCCGGNAPTPPNPYTTAAVATGTNVSTALANQAINSTNQVTPYGSLTYTPTDTYQFTDPTLGTSYSIPRYTATTSLSPEEQAIFGKSEAAKSNLAGLAQSQSGRLSDLLGYNLDTRNAPIAGDAMLFSNLPASMKTFGDTTDYNAARKHVEDALYERLQPQLDRSQHSLEQRLADQGIKYGAPGSNSAWDDYNRGVNDLRLGIVKAGSDEQQQAYLQDLGRAQFYNTGLTQDINRNKSWFDAANAARSNYLNEQYALRNQPINEISALLSGSQVSKPNFVTTPSTVIPTTDIAGLINTNFNQQFGNYKTQQESQDKLIGGLFGLGASLATGNPAYALKKPT